MNLTAPAPTPGARARTGLEILKATKQFTQENVARSWWNVISTLLFMVPAFAACALAPHWSLRLAASCLAGLSLVRLFVLFHDYEHGTILRRSRIAKGLFTFFGLVTLNPTSSWKRSHDYHHANNSKVPGSSVGTFPLMTIERYAQAPLMERIGYVISRHWVTMLLGYVTVFLYSITLKTFLTAPRKHWDCGLSLLVHGALVAAVASYSLGTLFFTIILPLAIASALGAYLFYSQHNFPGVRLREMENWDHVFAALRSSSYTEMGPVLRWFTGNIGYHHVHHLNARIPFYRLPEAARSIRELHVAHPIRLRLRDVRRCLSLKLWDEERNRMVHFGRARHKLAQVGA